MTQDDQNQRPLDRRLLLRGGAVLAGAAGVTVVGAALGPASAHATDGSAILAARTNTAGTITTLTVTAGAAPALSLVNTSGPSLRLQPLPDAYNGTLAVGDMAGSDLGPIVGVNLGNGAQTGYLLTDNDLAMIPVAAPRPTPSRLLDTRDPNQRGGILRKSSSTAIDSTGRLVKDCWIDVKVESAVGAVEVTGVFVNVAVLSPVLNGYLTVYPGPVRPNTSTINFRDTVSLSNAAFLAVATYADCYIVRIHSSSTTHVLLDYSGSVVNAASASSTPLSGADATRRTTRQSKRSAAMRAALSRV